MSTNEQDRKRFEAWIKGPPYERRPLRFPETSATWPGNYRELDIDLAWCAWQARALKAEAAEKEFWLWRNGDHFLAFEHLYPCYSPGGDPMTLGEPFGRAVFRRSFNRSGK